MRRATMVCLLLCICGSILAQKTITGKVTGSGGEPVPSASVSFNNRTSATTDVNGAYTIAVPASLGKYSLTITVVSFKSFNQTVTIAAADSYTVDAVLASDILNLDEVVVTGVSAGTTRKQLGIYVSTVKADKLV